MLGKGPVTLLLYFPFSYCIKWETPADFPFVSTSTPVMAEVVLLQ